MRSIDLVMAKRPYDDSVVLNPMLWESSERAADDLRMAFNPEFTAAPPEAGPPPPDILDDAAASTASPSAEQSAPPMTPSVVVSHDHD